MSIRAQLAAAVFALAICACDSDQTCRTTTPTGLLVGHAPVIEALPDTSVVLGDTLRLRTSVSDPDGDDFTLHVTIIQRPEGEPGYTPDVSLDPQSAELVFVPHGADLPERAMLVTAVDEYGYASSIMFTVAVTYYHDQTADVGSAGFGQNIIIYRPFGQEFVPDLGAVDIVQLSFDGQTDARLVVNIREGTITGPVVGVSDTTSFPGDFHGIATFEFDRVALVPGELYVIEIVQVSGRNWLGKSFDASPYDLGRQVSGGVPQEWNDLWFREGLRRPLPPVRAVARGRRP